MDVYVRCEHILSIPSESSSRQNTQWVTNENLFYHRCLGYLDVVL